MKGINLTRRELLAGAAGAGGAGALAGSGVAALLSDREILSDNGAASGTLDLLVEWDGDGGSGTSKGAAPVVIDGPTGERTLSVSLPGDRNNPAYVWLRTRCPGLAGVAADLDVTLSYATPDGSGGATIAEGSLLSVANDLRTGVPLDPGGDPNVEGERACLSTADTVDLRFEWTLTEAYDGSRADLFAFEFVGRQCRGNDGMVNPFPAADQCEGGSNRKAISFVAFCSDADEPIDPEIVRTNATDDDGDPTAVDWETDAPVGYVVVKFANRMAIYDLRDERPTAGTARSNDPAAAISAYDVQPGEASKPCAVAAAQLPDTGGFDVRRTAKLEYESGDWGADE